MVVREVEEERKFKWARPATASNTKIITLTLELGLKDGMLVFLLLVAALLFLGVFFSLLHWWTFLVRGAFGRCGQ